jgi:Chaperone of endosialidase
MLHTIRGVRKQPLLPISMTTGFAIALIFVTPAFGQDESAGGPTTASPEQTASLTAQAEGATVPRLVTFSGVLKDSSGKPATGTVTVAFSVYEIQEGGSPLWVETQAVQADAEGRYTVLLGATQPGGLPLDLFTTGRARWVGVQPQLPATAEQPRALLVGVPYALKAADADTLGGKPATAYVTTEALNAQSGAALPESAAATSAGAQALRTAVTGQARKDASSSGPLTACAKVTADGTATANFVAKFTASCVIHQSAIFESSGNVGIGNTSPAGKLDVSGNAFVRATFNLNQTTSSSVGVINMGSSPFIHACCSSSASNTFIGVNAGNFKTTGVGHNTASGFKALFANTTGSENTANGYFALSANTIGGSNTAIGHEALISNTNGFNNTATGFSAMLSNGSGTDNTAMGDSALNFNTTGSFNTAVGETALGANTTGKYNTALGYAANVGSGNLTNATALGLFATAGQSNAVVLGCTAANCPSGTTPPSVGIGTTTPSATLDVVAPNQIGLWVRGPESGVGAGLDLLTTGSGGMQWEILNTGSNSAQGPNKLNIRNVNTGNDVLTILASGAVGIATRDPDNSLTVNGSADKPGGGSWGTFSDGRLKTVAGTYNTGLDAILKLTPVRYHYKEQNAMGIKDGQEHVGFVAQDVEKAIPEAVTRNSRGYLLVNNDPILWTMLNAIKQQQAEIEVLTRSVHDKDAQIQKFTQQAQASQRLQRRVAILEERLAQVEAKGGNSLDVTLAAAHTGE